MRNNLTIRKSQLEAANSILARLREAVSPEFLGLIATSGHPITIVTSPELVDTDAIASLAASSFAATGQLAKEMKGTEFTVMFHEGNDLNFHIAQVSDRILLVVCFRNAAEIGRVRLICKKAIGALDRIITTGGE